MKPKEFTNWINRVYATKDKELDCDHIQSLLPAYAEAGLNGSAIHPLAAEIESHLLQCPDCTETYQGLRYLLKMEASGELAPTGKEPATAQSRPPESELTPVATP